MGEDNIEQKSTEEQRNAGEGKNKAVLLAQEGKYLTFALGKEDYGLEILKVREIIGRTDITLVPQVPDYVKGVINLRGKVIPVINLRLKFGMEEIADTSETCIIIVTLDDVLIGIMIDRVKDVLDINLKDIEPPPNLGSGVKSEFLLGIGKVNDSIKMLLNIDYIVGEDLALAQ